MEPLFEHRQEFAGYATRVLELEGSGPPLLLLHGYADSADTWRPVLAALGRAERRAIAVDLPGFGAADRLHRDQPILPQLDAFARAAAQYAGARPVVAGNLLGGCVALRMGEDDALDPPAWRRSRPPAWTWRAGSRWSSATRFAGGRYARAA